MLATATLKGGACVSEGPTHNHYMFSVFCRDMLTDGAPYLAEIDSYWRQYVGQDAPADNYTWHGYYDTYRDLIMETARRRGDRTLMAYLTQLNRYLDVCADMSGDAWQYPTRQQTAARRQKLASVLAQARAYKGTALTQQYLLLQMRANMMLGNDAANKTLWTTRASRLSRSPWRQAMQGIYARALYKTGQLMPACDIYASLGDMRSIKAVMRHYRNMAGIKTVYGRNPNAPSLRYLVQDFVNNVQETIDQKPQGKDDEEWLNTIDARAVYRQEAMQFAAFAVRAAGNAQVKDPAMWLAAASMIHYLFGDQQEAMQEADRAVSAAGTQRMRDNARAIRLLVSTRSNTPSPQYKAYLLGEMQWLDKMIAAERGTAAVYDNHYTDVKDRVVHRGLEPLFRSAGQDNTALALCAMMSADNARFGMEHPYSGDTLSQDLNMKYGPWSEYFCKTDSLGADRLASYYAYLSAEHADAFEAYCTSHSYRNAHYFNDLIGTKLLAEGRFADAVTYLDKVPVSFLSRQLISVYASRRHYDTPRWFGRQRVDEADTYEPVPVSGNIKARFCRDMTALTTRYNLMREGADKQRLAYDLAVRYYQASCYGDCWFLTRYYHSVSDSARSWERDFAAEAVKYLHLCCQSSDTGLRYRSLYALASVPADPWCRTDYDADWHEVLVPRPKAAQYEALAQLDEFARLNPDAIDHYTSRCDVLCQFRKAAAK